MIIWFLFKMIIFPIMYSAGSFISSRLKNKYLFFAETTWWKKNSLLEQPQSIQYNLSDMCLNFEVRVPPSYVLFGGTVLPSYVLSGRTVPLSYVSFGRTFPPSYIFFGRTFPTSYALFGRTVPPNSFCPKML